MDGENTNGDIVIKYPNTRRVPIDSPPVELAGEMMLITGSPGEWVKAYVYDGDDQQWYAEGIDDEE